MATKRNKITVALSSDFLTAFSKLPRSQQAKVQSFVSKFQSNPMSPGINYEKIMSVRDSNLRSVRIDQSYRAIVLKPEEGQIYVLLWVDQHDKAYKWAECKEYKIHPQTGGLQVIDVEKTETIKAPQEQDPAYDEKGLFSDVRDRFLIRLGVPEILIPLVRSIKTEVDLDNRSHKFPQEASEALYALAAGYTLDEITQEMERLEDVHVDTNDFETALYNPDSQQRFYVVEDSIEFLAILNAPLEKWRVFLHPSQRKLVEKDWNGPVRVLGGAGTGKTVVALHRAKWLAQNVFTGENDKILFTTFTTNLATDIQENLNKICSDEILKRIEVINFDKWVSAFLRRCGYDYKIDYGKHSDELWEKALDMAPSELDFDSSFYREEWIRIIQQQSTISAEDYIKASRIGRGVRLSRKDRKAIWPVFEEYRVLLNENSLKEVDDAIIDAQHILQNKGDILPYKAIIVDEAQDMSSQAFKLIRQIVPKDESKNSIFIVGDAHQRIYRHKVVLSHCGINIRGRSRKLKINYRTTDETRKWAIKLLEGVSIDDLDGGIDNQKGYKSLLHGIDPIVKHFESFSEEIEYISNFLKKNQNEKDSLSKLCIVVRTNNLLEQYKNALNIKGFETYVIKRSLAEDRNTLGLRLATMHRVKGLEFDRVVVAGVNDGIVPYEIEKSFSDQLVQKESGIRERALLYVSVTRAKKEALVTSFGKPSRFLNIF